MTILLLLREMKVEMLTFIASVGVSGLIWSPHKAPRRKTQKRFDLQLNVSGWDSFPSMSCFVDTEN